MSAEEIKKVLMENPSILVSKPEIIYEALARLTPWQNLATKDDIRRLEERMATKEELKKLEDRMATKEDLKKLEEKMATKEELKRLEERLSNVETNMATKEELRKLEEKMVTKEDAKNFATKEDLKQYATKKDLEELKKYLDFKLDALGARWGIVTEETFRKGVAELLREAGWNVKKEILYDKQGYVYGKPSVIEYDVIIKDGKIIMVEISSSIGRDKFLSLERRKEFYEMEKNVKVDKVVVVTAYISDKYRDEVLEWAKEMGIEIITSITKLEGE